MNALRLSGVLLLGVSCTLVPMPAGAEHLHVSPSFGVWRWDLKGYPDFDTDEFAPVWGVRGGYSPTAAFTAELVALTGVVSTRDPAAETAGDTDLRQTLLELSLLVNFQSLVSRRFYPFLSVGAGVALRKGGPETSGDPALDDSQVAFHLGGGLAVELDSRWGLRLNLRDTFFTDDRLMEGNGGNPLTVDSVELSAGLVLRFPVGTRGHRSLQHRGIDSLPNQE